MKVLITSGGTKIKIDLVRSITNMSQGTFGSKICDSFMELDNETDMTFFYAKNSKLPKCDLSDIRLIEYDTFDSYRERLCDLLKREHFDIIVLAAAVSDYGVKEVFNGKYRSSSDEMTIQLVKLPKVITEVRKLAEDSTICGFKLLVNSTDQELRDAMFKQFEENKIDLCVGNDLRDIKNSNHRLTIKTRLSDYFEIYEKSMEKIYSKKLEDVVVDRCVETYKRTHK